MDTSKNNGQIGKIGGTIGTTAQWNQGFSYDELGRLSNVVEHQGSSMSTTTYSQGYSFDRYGNRAQSANSTLGLPGVSSSDYSASTNRFGSGLATYDAAGNITTDAKFRSLNYSYDANGRQTSATNGTWTETQVYDGAGQRVQTTANSVTRTMVYDIFGQDVADYSGSTLERENIYRGGQLVATYEAGTSSWKYVMQDAQGSTRAMMNNNGSSSSVIARHDYLPFGEEIASGIGLRTSGQGYAATDTNRQKYAMTERDDVTGLDHTWWRKYENLSGRWTSPDPYAGSMSLGDPQSFNRYAYVQSDPVNFVDPTGLMPNMCLDADGMPVQCPDGGSWTVNVYVSWADRIIDSYGADRGLNNGLSMRPFIGGQRDVGGGDGLPTDHKELRDDFYNFLKTMSQDCKDALKPYIGTLSKLAYGASMYDVNTRGSEPASNYVRHPSAANRTLGQFFDDRGRDALSISYSIRDGICFRSASTFSGDGMYLLLHEMMHIVVPRQQVGTGEQDLANRLGVSRRGNENWSDAVSRYFSSKCNPAELGP